MANRVMQAKRQRMRRAYLRKPRSAGPPRNHPILEMQRISAASLQRDADVVARFKGLTEPRYQALLRRQVLLKQQQLEVFRTVGEICPDLFCFTLIDNHVQKCLAFFTADKSCWLLVWYEYQECRVRRSITYPNKDMIVDHWNHNRIKWVERKALPHPSG